MKHLNPFKLFLALAFILGGQSAIAQLDSANVFLLGNYLEVGICQNGGYGSTINAPITYVAQPGATNTFYDPADSSATCVTRPRNIGFVADPDKDGFTTGTPPFFGDYFLPGYPQEGWGIEVNGTEMDAYTNALTGCGSSGYAIKGGTTASAMDGTNVFYTNLGSQRYGVWKGTFLADSTASGTKKLAITQTTTVDTANVFFIVYVTIKNIGTATCSSIYYMRTLDPDNDETEPGGTFTTRNVITYKIPNAQNKVLVSAYAGTYRSRAYLGLGTEDCRALAFIVTGSLVPSDYIDKIYNHTSGTSRYDSLTSDVGVGLTYKLGDLAPGDSTAITYAYILNINELDSAFAATRPKWSYTGDSASLLTGDTASVCKNSVSTVTIQNGGAYQWVWYVSPTTTPYSPTTGPYTNVTVGTSPVRVMAIGTSPACFTDTVQMLLIPNKTPPAPGARIYSFCQFAIPTRLSATGTNLLWYTTATGGVGSSTAPTPSTTVASTTYYYLSQTIKGCESDRTQMTVIVHAGNVDSFSYNIHYGCGTDTVLFRNLSTGTITSTLWDFGDGARDTVSNPTHVYAAQGSYVVTLTTLNTFNCKYSTKQTVTITHPLTSSFTASPDTTCEFKPITFKATSTGTAPLNYLWLYGDGSTGTGSTSSHFYSLTGTYTVKLVTSDFVPCNDTAYRTVTIDTFATANFTPSDSMICEGKAVTFNGDYSQIGNVGAIWHFGDGSTLLNDKHPKHSFDEPGLYTVTLTAKYRQCPDTTVTKQIRVYGLPLVNLGPDTSLCPSAGSIIIADRANGTGATWLWNTGETSSSIRIYQHGTYYTTVTVNGCSNSDTVEVRNDCYLNVPNAFTPNGDGSDDYFLPRQLLSSGATSFQMSIYNRWGELLFQTTSLNGRGWDGKYNGTNQPTGVYIYTIDVAYKDGKSQHLQGNVTLLR
ncbi:MAG: gliding motility-associated C-terminal domain-containing protein [Taibaiella sp.]|nr:gliding motility-associated C-terminal domain-containing protein [Taibaiella sp.]